MNFYRYISLVKFEKRKKNYHSSFIFRPPTENFFFPLFQCTFIIVFKILLELLLMIIKIKIKKN